MTRLAAYEMPPMCFVTFKTTLTCCASTDSVLYDCLASEMQLIYTLTDRQAACCQSQSKLPASLCAHPRFPMLADTIGWLLWCANAFEDAGRHICSRVNHAGCAALWQVCHASHWESYNAVGHWCNTKQWWQPDSNQYPSPHSGKPVVWMPSIYCPAFWSVTFTCLSSQMHVSITDLLPLTWMNLPISSASWVTTVENVHHLLATCIPLGQYIDVMLLQQHHIYLWKCLTCSQKLFRMECLYAGPTKGDDQKCCKAGRRWQGFYQVRLWHEQCVTYAVSCWGCSSLCLSGAGMWGARPWNRSTNMKRTGIFQKMRRKA